MQVSMPSHIDGFSSQKFPVQIIPVLTENCNGIPCNFTADSNIQPNWIVMSSSQPWAIAVNNSDWSLVLLGNTVSKALITISVMDIWVKPIVTRLSLQYFVSSNLMTSLGCSDLGYSYGPPVIILNETIVQVWYHSSTKIGSVTLGVHIGGEFDVINVTSMVPSSAFDYSHSYIPSNSSSLPLNTLVLVHVFNEFSSPIGYVNLANIYLAFTPKFLVEYYNVSFESPLKSL
jgi:hypothetical protein